MFTTLYSVLRTQLHKLSPLTIPDILVRQPVTSCLLRLTNFGLDNVHYPLLILRYNDILVYNSWPCLFSNQCPNSDLMGRGIGSQHEWEHCHSRGTHTLGP